MVEENSGRRGLRRLSANLPPELMGDIRSTANILEESDTFIVRRATELYASLVDTIANGGNVEITVWQAGESKPTRLTPLEFLTLQRRRNTTTE